MTTKQEPEETLEDDVVTAQSEAVEHPESEQEQSQHEDTAHGTDGDGGATDWKAQARKWERRAKQYKAKIDTVGQEPKGNSDDNPDAGGELAKRIAELEAENQQLKAAGERRTLMERVAKDTGVPASLLHGDSEEELRAMAGSLKQWASTLGRNTPTSLGSEPDTPQSANLELIRELFNEQ